MPCFLWRQAAYVAIFKLGSPQALGPGLVARYLISPLLERVGRREEPTTGGGGGSEGSAAAEVSITAKRFGMARQSLVWPGKLTPLVARLIGCWLAGPSGSRRRATTCTRPAR